MNRISTEDAARLLESVGYTVNIRSHSLACRDDVLLNVFDITDGTINKDKFEFFYRLGETYSTDTCQLSNIN